MLSEQFIHLAGDPRKWDAEVLHRIAQGESLVAVQEDQHRRGRRSALLMKTSRGYVVRSAKNHLDQDGDSGPESMPRAEAILWGVRWALEDPRNREFYMSEVLEHTK